MNICFVEPIILTIKFTFWKKHKQLIILVLKNDIKIQQVTVIFWFFLMGIVVEAKIFYIKIGI